MTKQIRLNAFAMNCVAHQSPGLWTHPRDRTMEYNRLPYWLDLAKALERGIPAIIGVPARNLSAWRDFAGEFSIEFSEDIDQIAKWLASLEDKSLCGAG